MIHEFVTQHVLKPMLLLSVTLSPLTSHSDNTLSGNLACTVTGNVLISSEEGKFKEYKGFKDGIKTGDTLNFEYRFSDNTFNMSLKKIDQKIIINTNIFNHDKQLTGSVNPNGFYVIDKYDKATLSDDYIRIYSIAYGELIMRRYYKNDWHGMYTNLNHEDMSSLISTINCRQIKDEISYANNIYLKFWNKNE